MDDNYGIMELEVSMVALMKARVDAILISNGTL